MKILQQYKGLRKEIYVICLCKFVDNLGSLVGPMLTLILSNKLNMSATKIASFSIFFMVLAFPFKLIGGKIADKVNKKLLVNICDLSSTLIYIICGLVGINKTTIMIYMCGSLLQAIESPAYDTLVADYTTGNDREKAYSLTYLCLNFGLIAAPVIGGLLMDKYLDLMFIISGIFQLISIIIFDINIKETIVIKDDSNKYENEIVDKNSFEILKENKVIFIFLFISGLQWAVYGQWNYLLPLDLSFSHGEQGNVIYGLLSSINCITVLLATVFMTKYLSKFITIKRIVIGEILQCSGYVIFLLTAKQYVYYLAIFVFTLGEIANTISTGPFMTKRIPSNYRGRISSINEVIGGLICAVFQYITGIITDNYGTMQAWIMTFIIVGITIISLLAIIKLDKESYPELYDKQEG